MNPPKNRLFPPFIALAALIEIGVPVASTFAKDALFVSYDTPQTKIGLQGRSDLVDKLESAGFRMTIVSDRFPLWKRGVLPPTPENFVAALGRLAADREVHELAIILDLHGLPRKPKGERSHSVLFGKTEFSLDRLAPSLRKLRKRGSRVVLLDLSCYSGASIPLSEEGACVATSGSKEAPTYAQFLDGFTEVLRPGMSFEDAFLAARAKYRLPQTPRISAEAAFALDAEENAVEAAFLQTNLADALKLEASVRALDWNPEEWESVDKSYARWRAMGEPAATAAILPFPELAFQPSLFLQTTIRYEPLVTAERAFFARKFRAFRGGAEAGSACSEFAF